MKIGVMTHWQGRENYGQQLQFYAMQTRLLRAGHEPFLIRYAPKESLDCRLMNKIRHPQTLFDRFKKRTPVPTSEGWEKRRKSFDDFKATHLRQSSKIYTSPSLMHDPEISADAYICGSDQVWKFLPLNRFGAPWFLDFAPRGVPRIAYSASFGVPRVSPEFRRFIRPLLQKMNAIGVREKSGVEICREAGRFDAEHVLDPVLLLRAEDYEPILSRSVPEGGAMGYFLSCPASYPWDEIRTFIMKRFAAFRFVPVYDSSVFPFVENFYHPTIPQWLGSIRNAEAVLTNSFHGTCFSILFRRAFLFFPFPDPMSERIFSLLGTLGLNERIYDPRRGAIETQWSRPIEWDQVAEKLEKMRKKSNAFLEKALNINVL